MGHYFEARRDDIDKEIELLDEYYIGTREDFYKGYDMMTNSMFVLQYIVRY